MFTASTLKKKIKDELFVMSHNEVPKNQRALVFQEGGALGAYMIQESFKHYMKK